MNEEFRQALTTSPATREKIAIWVKFFLEFDIHKTVRCSHAVDDTGEPHSSQLDYVEEAFLHKYSSAVVMAARNAGKSYAAAITCLLDCWFKPGIKIAVAAFQRNQSDYIYTYLCAFLDVFQKRIGVKMWTVTKDEITFKNGSSVAFFSGGKSQAGIKGYHPNILIIDECDLFSHDQFDGIANALEAGGKFQRRLDVLSTNYTVSGDGVVLKQIERYREFNKTKNPHLLPCRIFKVCLIDILAKCDDRFECATCPLFPYCKGKAKDGEGFYKIESAMETMRDSSKQTFESQMLLLRPSSEYAYFHNFDSAKNVIDPDRPLDPTMMTFTIWDFGGAKNPHVCLVAQKSVDGVFYMVDEILGMGNLEHLIGRVLSKYPDATEYDCFADPKGKSKDQVKGSRSPLMVLREYGFFPRTKLLKRDPTAEILFNLIDPADGKVRFKVNKRCVNLLKQIYAGECEVYRGKPTNKLVDTRVDDVLDCARYLCGWAGASTYAKHNGSKRLQWFGNRL